ncbi:MAG: polyphosphate kinase 1 [Crocinitomicaceae bacterium]|nr:polyphosphate kinase 1 [Crocinitomicaceae bacterium]
MELINREISWLSFNERVLQEALDDTVPIIERMRFLGIYSNNMDEFYRVRVAYVRRLIAIKKKKVTGFKGTPADLMDEIRNVVMRQQIKFQIAYKKILLELEQENIYHVTHKELTPEQELELKTYFKQELQHAIVPIILTKKNPFPHLKDSGIYLAVEMYMEDKTKRRMALIQIPKEFPRFYRMQDGSTQKIILLDDIIRLNLKTIFSIFVFDHIKAYTFKFSRDAELDIDDDISVSFMEKIRQSIKKRKLGEPVRFVYDEKMSEELLKFMLKNLNLKKGINTIPGGKYHNFKDFMSFPDFSRQDFVFEKRPPIWHPRMVNKRSLLKEVAKGDVLLHYPYQRFDHVVDLLRESAIDPKVKSIKINVYRVAKKSQVMNALINAVLNGKQVFVVVELQARFDEENNLYWANRLREAGAKVSFGMETLKVHSKMIQIHRAGSKGDTLVSYVGTGNFHEKTANIYEDLGLLTINPKIGEEVNRIFNILDGFTNNSRFETLLVSPFTTRQEFGELIENEIQNAQKGREASIRIKFNNLVDSDMIKLLYRASAAGVKIDMIVRGICCLIPEKEGLSENIRVQSIVGRYLEHSRYLIFHNGGSPKYYLSSADWMERNLDGRIEVGCPIFDPKIQERLENIFEIQWKGNVKSRIIDEFQSNRYYRDDNEPFFSQDEMYKYYEESAQLAAKLNPTK